MPLLFGRDTTVMQALAGKWTSCCFSTLVTLLTNSSLKQDSANFIANFKASYFLFHIVVVEAQAVAAALMAATVTIALKLNNFSFDRLEYWFIVVLVCSCHYPGPDLVWLYGGST